MRRLRDGVGVLGRQKCEVFFLGSELIWDGREVRGWEENMCCERDLGIPLPRVVGMAATFERG